MAEDDDPDDDEDDGTGAIVLKKVRFCHNKYFRLPRLLAAASAISLSARPEVHVPCILWCTQLSLKTHHTHKTQGSPRPPGCFFIGGFEGQLVAMYVLGKVRKLAVSRGAQE